MQDSEPLQSDVRWHTGAASPGVTQKPLSHTMASVQAQQSWLVEQPLRQTPFTHI